MKKILLALCLICFALPILRADDAEDVKKMIQENSRKAAALEISKLLADFAPGFQLILPERTISFDELRGLLACIDGNHPMEYLMLTTMLQSQDKRLSHLQMQEILNQAKDEQFLAKYKKECETYRKRIAEAGALRQKTLNISDVKVNGDIASAVVKTEIKDLQSGQVTKEVFNCKLQKENQRWRFTEISNVKK